MSQMYTNKTLAYEAPAVGTFSPVFIR